MSILLTGTIQQTPHSLRLKPLSTALFDRILPYGFIQLVKTATRVVEGVEPSGLDHFYSNRPQYLSDIQVMHKGGSDHKLIMGTRYTKARVDGCRTTRKRSFKNFDGNKFLEKLSDVRWWSLYACENLNEAVKIFTDNLTSILDELAPVKTFQVRKHYAPWLSRGPRP